MNSTEQVSFSDSQFAKWSRIPFYDNHNTMLWRHMAFLREWHAVSWGPGRGVGLKHQCYAIANRLWWQSQNSGCFFSWLTMNLEKKLNLLFSLWVFMHSKQHNYISGNSISPCISFSNSEHTVAIMTRIVRDSLADASIMSDDIRGLLQSCCYKLTAF